MEKIQAYIIGNVITSTAQAAFALYERSSLGEKVSEKIQYTLSEAIYLVEKNKMEVYDKKKKISYEQLLYKLKRFDKRLLLKARIFADLREKGYIVKTALKFGADFRVYAKGQRPGDEHASWLLYAVHESEYLKWHEFSAKNRVAHSTKKNLLIGIVDEEGDATYYEISWRKM